MSGGLSEAAQDTAAPVGAGAHADECTRTPAAPLPGGLPNPGERALNPDHTCNPHLRALLVEDDAEYAGLVVVMLNSVASVRFQVDHTTSAHAAIERLSQESYDILLLDLGLPDAQGLEALNLLLLAVPDLPIVILSGADNEDLALRAVKAGAQDYLIKGDTTTDLLARAIRYAIERKQSELHIKHLAYYDSLTQLPNRRLLMDHLRSALTRARRNGHVVGVVFLDVDDFKQINDTLGHEAGDSVLQELAKRLPQTLRESDTLARLSGDEFVAVVEVKRQQELSVVAESLRRQLATPFTAAGRELVVKTSIGVSSYPADGVHAHELLRSADRAMYRAKAEGRDAHRSDTPLEERLSVHSAITSGIYGAIERRELRLHFQPIVDLRSAQIDGLEALVRWQHPGIGLIGPAKFIPKAEESELILAIERWVLHAAMKEAASQYRAGFPLRLAINLSRRHFDHPALLSEVRGISRQVGYDTQLLELEITESGIMRAPQQVRRHLKAFRRLGIRVVVDDFGTGFSCLSVMKHFPLNALKIDRSFVRNCAIDRTNRALVAAIISMAHALGLQVTAEGVETDAQLAYLREQNCDRAQGSYFSPPVPASRLPALLGGAPVFRI